MKRDPPFRRKIKTDLIAADLVEDKAKNRLIFLTATLLSYLYLTWSLYLSGSSVSLWCCFKEFRILSKLPSSTYLSLGLLL